ncbi:MAG: NAD(P)/FAD-dependent oxidoreductase [Firmicutes bacterium]|nr:NAD(P)/FAD-dependent oxidoreductase [Bacillota bacterium]
MKSFDVIIIGAGPAGLTAALYAARASLKTLVAEKSACGGQMLHAAAIENFPAFTFITGADLARRMHSAAEAAGAQFVYGTVQSAQLTPHKKTVSVNGETYAANALIIATGKGAKTLGIADEARFEGFGVSYCTSCEGAFFKGKDVAVVGDALKAQSAAAYLAPFVRKLYIVSKSIQGFSRFKNAEVIPNAQIVKLSGNDALESITLQTPHGEKRTLNVSGLFVTLGSAPNSELFKQIIKTDKHGFISTDKNCRTNSSGVFCAGDVRAAPLKQIITACADGATAATAAIRHLRSK